MRTTPTTPSDEVQTEFSDEDARQAIARSKPHTFLYIASPQEKLFAREMALTGNLARSYRLAYPELIQALSLTPAQQRAKAARLLGKSRVDEVYTYFRDAVNQRMDIREDRVLQELAAVAFGDVGELYEDDGQTLRNIHTIPRHVRSTISKFKTGYTKDGRFTEVQVVDKMKALQLLVSIKNMDGENKAAKAPVVKIQLAQNSNRGAQDDRD